MTTFLNQSPPHRPAPQLPDQSHFFDADELMLALADNYTQREKD
jgi:hypothetical protein